MRKRGVSGKIPVLLLIVIMVWVCCGCGLMETVKAELDTEESKPETFDDFLWDLFEEAVIADTITLHYTLADPETFGIDASQAATFGEFSLSEEDIEAGLEEIRGDMETLASFDYESLDEEEQYIYDILQDQFELDLESYNYIYMEEPFAYTSGLQTNLPIIMAEYAFYDEKDVKDYFTLLEKVPGYFEACLTFERTKSEKGLFMSKRSAEEVIRQCSEFIEHPAENMLIATFNDRIGEVEGISPEEAEEYRKDNYEIIMEQIIPSYEEMISAFEELKETSQNQLGLCYFPDGEDYYKYLLRTMVGTDKTPKQVIELLDEKMEETLKDYEDTAYSDYDAYLDYYNGAALYENVEPRETIEYFAKAFSKDFPAAPEYDFKITPIHDSLKNSTSPAYYVTPPIDAATTNSIYVNPDEANSDSLWSTLAHEGVPGHMYQCVYFNSLKPDPIRAVLDFGGYSEGWATYAEMMSYDVYEYERETYRQLERCNNELELLLCARIEIGVNYQGWTLEDTKDYVEKNGFNADVAEEMMEYVISEPVNYQMYCLGWLEFEQLRDEAERELGDEFEAQEFHKVLLDAGPSPFYLLRERVGEYIYGDASEVTDDPDASQEEDLDDAA